MSLYAWTWPGGMSRIRSRMASARGSRRMKRLWAVPVRCLTGVARRPLHPVLTVAVDLHDRAAGMSLTVCAKPREQAQVAAIRRPQSAVRNLEEILLDLPDVCEGQAPVVLAQGAQIRQLAASDAAREVHVWIEVAPHQIANAAEHRFAAVQARIPGPSHRPPPTSVAEHVDHMIHPILGLEADHKRWIAVLLQDHGSDERRLQTVRGLEADDLAKRSECVPAQLPVVGQPAQELLDLFRGAVSLDDSPLFAGEEVRRLGRLGHGPTILQRPVAMSSDACAQVAPGMFSPSC